MSRFARLVVPGVPHHITQRGNRREDVFFDDASRFAYLNTVRYNFRAYGVDVIAYCLMTNHVHFVAVPHHADSFAKAFRDAHAAYAQSLNRWHELSGHLWQGRFFSCPLDEAHLWAAIRYVEMNPVRAGIVVRPEEYMWSSAATHCGLRGDMLLAAGDFGITTGDDWRNQMALELRAETDAIRINTLTGRPCGSEQFSVELEKQMGRRLRPGKAGRRKKDSISETASLFRLSDNG